MPASDVLPRPGGPGEQHVVARLAARPGGLEEDRELLLDLLLADELGQVARPQRAVELLLARRHEGVGDPRARSPRSPAAPGRDGAGEREPHALLDREVVVDVAAAPPRPRPPTCRARRARRAPRCGRRRPASAGVGVAAIAARPPTLSLRSITTRSAVRRPMPGMLVKRAWSPACDGPPDLVGRVARHDRERGLGPDAGDAEQELEQRPLGRSEAKPIERSVSSRTCRCVSSVTSPPSASRRPARRRGGGRRAR